MHAFIFNFATARKAKLGLGFIPFRPKIKAMAAKVAQHIQKILPNEMRQHETIMQASTPAGELASNRCVPKPRHKGSNQHLLRKAHARIRGHLETTKFDKAKAASWAIWRVELIDADFSAVRIATDIDEKIA